MKKLRSVLSLVMAAIMLLAMVPAASAAAGTGFTDVPASADYAEAVTWCRENGLMQGVSADSFSPNGTLTRAMVATVLYRAAGEPSVTGVPTFTDVPASEWYSNAVIWATGEEIVRGYGNGLFGTNDPVTREQLDILVRRYAGEDPAWTGNPALSIPATRAEAAVAFYTYLREQDTAKGKTLVVYFSASGNTGRVAGYIAEATGADTFELTPETPYTSEDLNWTASGSRVNREHDNEALRDIALEADTVDKWDSYDTVFIGYPIWWGIAAWPVNNFVKNNDFTGKTVIPFCTSSSSGLGQSGELLAELAGTGNWQEGRRFSSGTSQEQVTQWVNGLELTPGTSGTDNPRILVTYFSMPETANANNMTTEEDNSVVVINGQVLGNTQYMAQVIQETTGGDIFRIEPVTPYPTDHSTLVSLASQEQSDNARPSIQGSVANMDDYDVIFVGYPIWWSDMPMILYSFFEQYDFSGKTIVPFSTHGGSSFAGTPATIQALEPGAKLLDGLTISRNSIQGARQEIVNWVNGLALE